MKHLLQLGHLELLVALILLQVIQSFFSGTTVGQRILVNVLLLTVVFSTIRSFAASKRWMLVALTLGVVAFGLSCIAELFPSKLMSGVTYTAYIAIFLLLVASLGEDVFTGGPVNSDRIVGAVCIFFLLGLIWAFLYSLLETFSPGSFLLTSPLVDGGIRQDLLGELHYFSNVTLTTLGYGDIVPLSRPARVFATLEAMVGQLYIATVVARLVGLYISKK